MSRDDYIEHLRARLKAAEEVIHQTTKQDPVGWQFFENGEWHQGGLFNSHRRNTEEAGYPVRDVYAGPVVSVADTEHKPHCNVLHPLEETGVCDCKPPVIDWAADAENWGNALNDAGWAFTEACPENSALLFNNTKAPLREAIKVYLAAVAAEHKS